MIVNCEGCGKKYRVEPEKIKGREARFKCRGCSQIVTVVKPEPEPEFDFDSLDIAVDSPISEPSTAAAESLTGPILPEVVVGSESQSAATSTDAAPTLETGMTAAPARKGGLGLTAKLLLIMLLVSLVPLGIYAFISIQQTRDRLLQNEERMGAQVTEGLATQVDEWIDKNLRVLKALAEMPAIQSMNRTSQEPLLKIVHEKYPWMYLVFTTDNLGMNISRNDGNELRDYSDRQYVKDVISGKEVAWQTLIGKTSKKPALVIAVPIQRNEGTVGVMAAAMTIDDISKRIANWRQGNTGYAFLVDEKGKVVAHQVNAFVQEQKVLSGHPLIAAHKKGQKGIIEFASDNGESAIGYARKTNYDWTLAVQQSKAEAFAPLKQAQNFALLLLAVTVLVVILIAILSSRGIVNPIKALTDAANRISVGDLEVEIESKSRDEIGDLSEAITRMQDSIRLSIARLRRRRR